MEKVKYVFIFVLFSLISVLTYSLLKSWFFFDKGIEVGEEEIKETEITTVQVSKDALQEHSKVIWKNYLYYPIDPSQEEGGIGPSGYMNHARNLFFVNLTTGKVKKLFDKKVYIWDYFAGDFTRKPKNSIDSLDSQKEKDFLEVTQKFIIFAVTKDTNGDGFLNNKDKMKLYVYDPALETMTDVLPPEYFVERLLFNTKKDFLALIIKALPIKEELNPVSKIFTFDLSTQKYQIIETETKHENGK